MSVNAKGTSEVRFFGLMSLTSALTLIRGFSVAAVVSVQDFGNYAVVVAIGSLLSIVLSAGRVELSMKLFPRLWVDGQSSQIIAFADRTCCVMLIRASAAALILLPVSWFLRDGMLIWHTVGAIAFGFAMAAVSNYFSALRSTGFLAALIRVNSIRAFVALLFAVVLARSGGWTGAVTGEILAAIVAACAARSITVSISRNDNKKAMQKREHKLGLVDHGGRWLFFSSLLSASVAYLDRPFVASYFGSTSVGEFGFLILFVTGSSTIVGILAQSAGPTIIHMSARGDGIGKQLRYISLRAFAVSGLLFVGLMSSAVLLLVYPLQDLGAAYGVSPSRLLPIICLCLLQSVVFFEWILLARDRESSIFFCSFGSSVILVVLACAIVWWHRSLELFLWSLVIARTVQLLALLSSIVWLKREFQSS